MGRVLVLLVIVAALLLVGQVAGLYDVPVLRDAQRMLPLAQPRGEADPPTALPAPAAQPATPSPRASPVPSKTDECTAASPRFVHGAAALKAALGEPMGQAIECERVVDAAGNTEQRTTTGLAYYRARNNVVVFTNGSEHWALLPSGVVRWTSDDVEPPPNAEPAS
jgi:hypothetical protein